MLSPDKPAAGSVRGTLVAVVALFVVDALVFSQGFFSTLVAGIMCLVVLARLAVAGSGTRLPLAKKLSLWVLLPVATIGTISANNALAKSRAETVIAAVHAYRAKHGVYPAALENLVPEFLPSVPRAKLTLGFHRFEYLVREDKAWLHYTSVPPFGRPTYNFAARRWGYLD